MKNELKMTAQTKSVQRVFDGFFKLDHYDIAIAKHDGGTMDINRLVLQRGHSVTILPYDPVQDKILMINEFSPGAHAAHEEPFVNTLPAGSIWPAGEFLRGGAA